LASLLPLRPPPAAVSPAGMSDYADEGVTEGPSPLNEGPQPFSTQHLAQLELAASLEGGHSGDNLSDAAEPTPGQEAAAAAAARVHGLRDDFARERTS